MLPRFRSDCGMLLLFAIAGARGAFLPSCRAASSIRRAANVCASAAAEEAELLSTLKAEYASQREAPPGLEECPVDDDACIALAEVDQAVECAVDDSACIAARAVNIEVATLRLLPLSADLNALKSRADPLLATDGLDAELISRFWTAFDDAKASQRAVRAEEEQLKTQERADAIVRTVVGLVDLWQEVVASRTQAQSKKAPQVESKKLPKVESKKPPKVESKKPPKVESKKPPKVESKKPPKVESKTPPKVESKTPPKVESRPPKVEKPVAAAPQIVPLEVRQQAPQEVRLQKPPQETRTGAAAPSSAPSDGDGPRPRRKRWLLFGKRLE